MILDIFPQVRKINYRLDTETFELSRVSNTRVHEDGRGHDRTSRKNYFLRCSEVVHLGCTAG